METAKNHHCGEFLGRDMTSCVVVLDRAKELTVQLVFANKDLDFTRLNVARFYGQCQYCSVADNYICNGNGHNMTLRQRHHILGNSFATEHSFCCVKRSKSLRCLSRNSSSIHNIYNIHLNLLSKRN